MNSPIAPEGVPPPAAAYELAMVTPAGASMLHTAGIVGSAPDGTTPAAVGDQARVMWRSIGAILDAAGFHARDIVSYTTYVVLGEDTEAVMAERDAFFGGLRAASTLILVPALARPEWKVEVSVVAAKSPTTANT